MTYYTGLDLHKRTLTAPTLDPEGAVVAAAKMPCRAPVLRAYFAQIPGDHAAAVECTTGWYWVSDALSGTVDLYLAHAKGVKAISAAKVKTDSADAAMLAHLLRTDLLPEAHMIADELRPLRDVLRNRLRLVERRVSAQNSRARLLEKHNVRDVADLDAFGRLQSMNALARTYVRQLAEREGASYVGFHGARHSFADVLRQNGASVHTISKALGHSSIAVTEAYLAAFDRADVEAEMRNAFGS